MACYYRYYFHETAQHGFTGRLFRKFLSNMSSVLQSASKSPVAQRLVERRGALEHPSPREHSLTLSTRQSFSGWLNDEALQNIQLIFVTLSTRQSFSGWLNDEAPGNILSIFVTLSTRQSFSGWLNDEAHIRCEHPQPLVERRGIVGHPKRCAYTRGIPRADVVVKSLLIHASMKSRSCP